MGCRINLNECKVMKRGTVQPDGAVGRPLDVHVEEFACERDFGILGYGTWGLGYGTWEVLGYQGSGDGNPSIVLPQEA